VPGDPQKGVARALFGKGQKFLSPPAFASYEFEGKATQRFDPNNPNNPNGSFARLVRMEV